MSDKLYQNVTDRIVAALKKGVVPWRKPWRSGMQPINICSKKPYQGTNVMMLAFLSDFADPRWGTLKQWNSMGVRIKAGEKSTPIMWYSMVESKTQFNSDGKPRKFPLLRWASVFNAEQTTYLDDAANYFVPELPTLADPEAVAQRYLATGPVMRRDGHRAFYRPSTDEISMPARSQFESSDAYYNTLFHEMAHSTGHASRLNRPGVIDPIQFGSHKYSREELVAEFTAAFLCGLTGIEQEHDSNASYIGHWLNVLGNDVTIAFDAAKAAAKAADFIQGKHKVAETEVEEPEAVAA